MEPGCGMLIVVILSCNTADEGVGFQGMFQNWSEDEFGPGNAALVRLPAVASF